MVHGGSDDVDENNAMSKYSSEERGVWSTKHDPKTESINNPA